MLSPSFLETVCPLSVRGSLDRSTTPDETRDLLATSLFTPLGGCRQHRNGGKWLSDNPLRSRPVCEGDLSSVSTPGRGRPNSLHPGMLLYGGEALQEDRKATLEIGCCS